MHAGKLGGRRRTVRGIQIAALGLIAASTAGTPATEAAVITQTLGTANYANGQTVGTGTFASNPSGDPAPFDRLIGNKTSGPNPSASFTFASYVGQSRARSRRRRLSSAF